MHIFAGLRYHLLFLNITYATFGVEYNYFRAVNIGKAFQCSLAGISGSCG